MEKALSWLMITLMVPAVMIPAILAWGNARHAKDEAILACCIFTGIMLLIDFGWTYRHCGEKGRRIFSNTIGGLLFMGLLVSIVIWVMSVSQFNS